VVGVGAGIWCCSTTRIKARSSFYDRDREFRDPRLLRALGWLLFVGVLY